MSQKLIDLVQSEDYAVADVKAQNTEALVQVVDLLIDAGATNDYLRQ